MPEDNNSYNPPEIFHKGTNKKAVLILHGFSAEVERTDVVYKFFCNKGFTVARPILPGHSGTDRDRNILMETGPEDWLRASRNWLERLSAESDEVYLLGVSFGGNLSLALATEGNLKIKGLALMEMPIFFRLRIRFLLSVVQPIVELMGVEFVRKQKYLYRKNFKKEGDRGVFNYIPVKAFGRIDRFIAERTLKELHKVTVPVLYLHAESSDMLNTERGTNYLLGNLGSVDKRIFSIPTDNHDMSLLDETGKFLMLEKISHFIEQL